MAFISLQRMLCGSSIIAAAFLSCLSLGIKSLINTNVRNLITGISKVSIKKAKAYMMCAQMFPVLNMLNLLASLSVFQRM